MNCDSSSVLENSPFWNEKLSEESKIEFKEEFKLGSGSEVCEVNAYLLNSCFFGSLSMQTDNIPFLVNLLIG